MLHLEDNERLYVEIINLCAEDHNSKAFEVRQGINRFA